MSEVINTSFDELPGSEMDSIPESSIDASDSMREIGREFQSTPAVEIDRYLTRLFPAGNVNFGQIAISFEGRTKGVNRSDLNSYTTLNAFFGFILENQEINLYRIPNLKES